MKIDKSKFLVLTTGIAAATTAALFSMSGCSSSSKSSDEGTQPTNDSGTTDATTSDSGGGDSSTDSGAACLADKGPAPICYSEGLDGGADADVDAATDGGTGDAKCAYECSRAVSYLKKDVAKAVNDCLDLAPTCEGASIACVDEVLPKVCDDATATDFCKTLISGCYPDADGGDAGDDAGTATSPLTQANCVKIAKALNEDGRLAFTSCVTESIGCDMAADCVDLVKQ